MEEERKDALEMGKEKKEKDQASAEEKSRRAVTKYQWSVKLAAKAVEFCAV